MAKGKGKKKRRSAGRFFLRLVLFLFVTSLVYTVLLKWVFPPLTLTQAGSLIRGEGLKRDYVRWEQIPPAVKLAAIASEDQLFPDHNGFDWKAIRKSVDPEDGQGKKGRPRGAAASTISQQTAKNVFLWQGSGWARYLRKIPEAYFTWLTELIWGKRRILEVYLNVAEMGKGIYGIEAAAQAYFRKPAARLSRREAAMIIACLPNPVRFTVVPVSRRVQWRAPGILVQMRHLEGDPEVQALLQPEEDPGTP